MVNQVTIFELSREQQIQLLILIPQAQVVLSLYLLKQLRLIYRLHQLKTLRLTMLLLEQQLDPVPITL